MTRLGRPPKAASERRKQFAFRLSPQLAEFLESWCNAHTWDRTQTVEWMLTTVMREFRVLGPRIERLLEEEANGGMSVGNAVGVKALDVLLREETRGAPGPAPTPSKR